MVAVAELYSLTWVG